MRARMLAAMLLCGLGCGGEAGPNGGEGLGAMVLSDPVFVGGRQVAYLSLPAGSVPEASSATVTNHRTGSTLVLAVDDGGWKAAELQAVEGDSIIVRMDQPALLAALAVPEISQPVVVRVEPPRGKRDVPLNARVYIAFSEPVDATTVTATSVRLVRDGTPVPGQVSVAANGLAATIDPDEDLAPNTDYEVTISAQVKDLDGDPAVPQSSDFSTGATAAAEVPDLQIDPSAADFGLAFVGALGNPRHFRIWNVGLGAGTFQAALSGPSASDYQITFDGCSYVELPVFGECTIVVTFAPSASGVRNAALGIGDASATLSGTAYADRLEFSPATFDFGPVMAGRATTVTDFVATNVGTDATTQLHAVLLNECTPQQISVGCVLPFRIVNDRCSGRSVLPGATCIVSLEFRPDRVGRYAARLALTSRATAAAQLDGEGLGLVSSAGSLSHEPLTIPWGLTATVAITNTGPERTGQIPALELSGPFIPINDDCSGHALESGGTCNVTLRFVSSSGQASSGLLQLAASPGGTVTIYLHGRAR